MHLLTRERALRNIAGLTSPTAAEYLLIDSLIAAVSQAVERYCCRAFAVQPYDELYDGNDRPTLLLRNFPVVSVERVAYEPTPVLSVQNTSASNQRASVKVTADGLTLTRVASGVTTSDTVTFAANATLSALQTAIAALSAGWSASIAAGYESYPSADLRATQGAFNAKDAAADLRLHVRELSAFDVDETRGYLQRRDPLRCAAGPVFYGGPNFWRIVYTAGFETMPDAVQEACAEWVAALFWQSKRDPGLTQEATVGVTSHSVLQDMPAMARTLLRPYRVIRI